MKLIDITGKTFGHLRVVSRADGKKEARWNCVCKHCDHKTVVIGSALIHGRQTGSRCSCLRRVVPQAIPKRRHAKNFIDRTGEVHGNLRVIEYAGKDRWIVKCIYCGSRKEMHRNNVLYQDSAKRPSCKCKLWRTGTYLQLDSEFVKRYLPFIRTVIWVTLGPTDYQKFLDDVAQDTLLNLMIVKNDWPTDEVNMRKVVSRFAANAARSARYHHDPLSVPNAPEDEGGQDSYAQLLNGITDGNHADLPIEHMNRLAALNELNDDDREFVFRYVQVSNPSRTNRYRMSCLRKHLNIELAKMEETA